MPLYNIIPGIINVYVPDEKDFMKIKKSYAIFTIGTTTRQTRSLC